MFNFNEVVSDIQDRAQEAVSTTADLAGNLWQEMQETASNTGCFPTPEAKVLEFMDDIYQSNGIGGEANIPNPIKSIVAEAGRMGEQVQHTVETIGHGLQDAWGKLENLPGLTMGGGGDIEINGKKVGGRLPDVEIQNPLRGIREGAEEVAGQVRERAGEAGETVQRGAEKVYSDLENVPDFSMGGGADVDINGEKRRIDLPRVEVKNPLRGKREEVEQKGEEAREKGEGTYDFLYNLPGVTLTGETGAETSENRVDFDLSLGANPFEGTDPSLNVYLRR